MQILRNFYVSTDDYPVVSTTDDFGAWRPTNPWVGSRSMSNAVWWGMMSQHHLRTHEEHLDTTPLWMKFNASSEICMADASTGVLPELHPIENALATWGEAPQTWKPWHWFSHFLTWRIIPIQSFDRVKTGNAPILKKQAIMCFSEGHQGKAFGQLL